MGAIPVQVRRSNQRLRCYPELHPGRPPVPHLPFGPADSRVPQPTVDLFYRTSTLELQPIRVVQRLLTSLEDVLVAIETPEEARSLMKLLFSPQEIESIPRRWAAIEMIFQGESQKRARETLGISRETGSRCARALRKDDPTVVGVLLARMKAKRGGVV